MLISNSSWVSFFPREKRGQEAKRPGRSGLEKEEQEAGRNERLSLTGQKPMRRRGGACWSQNYSTWNLSQIRTRLVRTRGVFRLMTYYYYPCSTHIKEAASYREEFNTKDVAEDVHLSHTSKHRSFKQVHKHSVWSRADRQGTSPAR